MPLFFKIVLEVLVTRVRKSNKRNPDWKSITVTVCRGHVENPKDNSRKLLELINEFGKFVGYKINIQKSVIFFYTNNKLAEGEIKETIPFITASKKNKINSNKHA